MMKSLSLSPLPALRAADNSGAFLMEREGFVDETVVTALVRGSHFTRSVVCPDDLALAADDLDFAGWRLTKDATVRSAEVPPHVIDAIVRRAAPPVIVEPGLGDPHQGNHRWWLAGLAGVLSTLLFSLLLLSLSARQGSEFETLHSPRIPTTAKPVAANKAEPDKVAPDLTEISPPGR